MEKEKLLADIVEDLIEKSENFYLEKEKNFIKEGLYPQPLQFLLTWLHNIINLFYKYFQYPFLMVSKGFDFAIREIAIWCVSYFILVLFTVKLADIVHFSGTFPPGFSTFLISTLIFLPMCIALFSPPSIFTKITTNKNIVHSLLNEIEDFAIASNLSEVFVLYKSRVEKRILKIKQIFTLFWVLCLYWLNKFFSVGGLTAELQREVFSLTIFLIFIGFCIFLLHAYEKSCLSIMNNIQIALIEANRQYKRVSSSDS